MIDSAAIRIRWETFGSKLDERGRRLFAAAEVRAAGRGGLALVSKITGLARSTINRGEDDLDSAPWPSGRIRREGGGRRALGDKDPGLRQALRRLVDPDTFGDPMRPLVWVSKSLDKLATALTSMGFPVGIDTVRAELRKLGFSRQGNRKAEEGSNHADRDAQFQYINATVVAAQGRGQPVVFVDTKKKELIGNFKNAGTDYRPKGEPSRVKVHDFEDKTLGKGRSLRRLRRDRQRGMGQPRDHVGHRRVRGCFDPLLAGAPGAAALSRRDGVDHHGRLRRFERGAGSAVESSVAGAGRRDGTDAPCPPLSARDVEMEQDRAPSILSHHTELARSSVDRSPRCRRIDRRHDDQIRPDGQMRH